MAWKYEVWEQNDDGETIFFIFCSFEIPPQFTEHILCSLFASIHIALATRWPRLQATDTMHRVSSPQFHRDDDERPSPSVHSSYSSLHSENGSGDADADCPLASVHNNDTNNNSRSTPSQHSSSTLPSAAATARGRRLRGSCDFCTKRKRKCDALMPRCRCDVLYWLWVLPRIFCYLHSHDFCARLKPSCVPGVEMATLRQPVNDLRGTGRVVVLGTVATDTELQVRPPAGN